MNKPFSSKSRPQGSVLVITIIAMTVLAILFGVAMNFTLFTARNTANRINQREQALLVADSLMEVLYAQFKDAVNNYKTSLGDIAPTKPYFSGTNSPGGYLGFQTANSKVPLGAAFPELAAYFPSVSNFSSTRLDDSSLKVVTVYDISPLDSTGRASGTTSAYVRTVDWNNKYEGQAYRYLATVAVSLPTLQGQTVTAQISRIFEFEPKSFLNYAIFSNVNLEIAPSPPMNINGPVFSNTNIYVGGGSGVVSFNDSVACSGTIFVGRMKTTRNAPYTDPSSDSNTSPAATTAWTNRTSNAPPVTPLGITASSFNTSDSNPNNDSYHEIVDLPTFPLTSNTDPLSPGDQRTSATQPFDSNNLQTMRFANVADYIVQIDSSVKTNGTSCANSKGDVITITYTSADGSTVTTLSSTVSSDTNTQIYKALMSAITPDSAPIVDARESASGTTVMNLTNVDVGKLRDAIASGSLTINSGSTSGLGLYIVDKRNKATYSGTNRPMSTATYFPAISGTITWGKSTLSGTSKIISGTNVTVNTEPAIRLTNGTGLPDGGLTIVTPNPVYVQGDYNTGGRAASGTLSAVLPVAATTGTSMTNWTTGHEPTTVSSATANSLWSKGPYSTNVTLSGTSGNYYWEPAAIIADAITVLSHNWDDSKCGTNPTIPSGTNTTINAAFFAGNVATTNSAYSGGIENFPRFLENWGSISLNYVGSMVLLYNSQQATGPWGTTTYYNPPVRRWAYDTFFQTYGVPLLAGGGSASGGVAGGGTRKSVAAGSGGKAFQRKQWISRTVQ